MECLGICNTSRDMGNKFSGSEASQLQPQLQVQAPLEKSNWEARPGSAQREATPSTNRAKSSKNTEVQALAPQKSLDGKTKREPRTVVAQREATPSQGYRGKAAENTTDVKPRETPLMFEKCLKLKFPTNFGEIMRHADSDLDTSSVEKLMKQLQDGVYLDKNTKIFWLDGSCNNCFMLYARAFWITWSGNPEYWKWVSVEDKSGTKIEVAELIDVCWLEAFVKIDTKFLSPGILYEVVFIVKLKDSSYGWEVPVGIGLYPPVGEKQERQENLNEKIGMDWIQIPVGLFVLSAQDLGEMVIKLYQFDGHWKRGLVIKGALIKPKEEDLN